MQNANDKHRRGTRCALLAMGSLTFAISGPAMAVTLQECAKEAEDVHEAGRKLRSSEFNEENFFKGFQSYINQINSFTSPDKDVLLDNVSALLSDAPEDAFEDAISSLRRCILLKRVDELGGVNGEDDEDVADATAEPGESAEEADNDLSGPPTPIGDPESWFTAEDYPAGAIREERKGRVSYDLMIGADGKVLGCQATGPSGGRNLESATCTAIMARARFNPATDVAGQPRHGEYSGTINWIF